MIGTYPPIFINTAAPAVKVGPVPPGHKLYLRVLTPNTAIRFSNDRTVVEMLGGGNVLKDTDPPPFERSWTGDCWIIGVSTNPSASQISVSIE